VKRLSALALVGFAAFCGPAQGQSNPAAAIYDAAEIETWRPRYQKGWMTNYRGVFLPDFTAEEKARLDGVEFRFEPIVPQNEPFAFYSTGDKVVASAASLKFLDDLSVATAWLDLNGFEQQTVADYMLMLHYWPSREGGKRPPKLLEALCIPADALSNRKVDERANRIFDSVVVFILLHELGHVFWGHPGYVGIPPETARANEEAADRFALDILARVNEAPLGVSVLFLSMANLWENRADFGTDEQYRRAMAARTHPLSSARLQSFASHLAGAGRGFKGDSRAVALKTSLDISQLALLLGDLDVQRLSASIGHTVIPADLAPRRRGQHLVPSCRAPAPTGLPFDGQFHGTVVLGKTDFDLDAVLRQAGDRVTGSYSFGAGFARIEGVAAASGLTYDWALPPDKGRGSGTLQDGAYTGTWGMGAADSGGGSVSLRRQH
jgi:hypothetical protein